MEQKSADSTAKPKPKDLLSYAEAFQRLTNRFPGLTHGELCLWVWEWNCNTDGDQGLPAYNRYGEEFYWQDANSLSDLRSCGFKPEDVRTFEPDDRWLTHEQLLQRWQAFCANPEQEIEAAVHRHQDELVFLAFDPLHRTPQLLKECCFLLSEVEQCEAEWFPEAAEKNDREPASMPNSDKLVLAIGNREAVPVRGIPFVTGGHFAIDYTIRMLAGQDGFYRITFPAYKLHDNGTYTPILAKEWDRYVAMLEGLTNKSMAEEEAELAGYATWRETALKMIPAKTFVWLDDLEKAWAVYASPERTTFLNERAGDREFTLCPLVTDSERAIILEGFQSLFADNRFDCDASHRLEPENKFRLRKQQKYVTEQSSAVIAALDALEADTGKTPDFPEVWAYMLRSAPYNVVKAKEGKDLRLSSDAIFKKEAARKVYSRLFQAHNT